MDQENISNVNGVDKGLLERAVKSGFWVFLSQVIIILSFFVKIVILARLLSPRDFGLFGVALLTLGILKIFARPGFELALIQKKENINSYLNSAWTVIIMRGLALFLIIFFIAPVITFYFQAPDALPFIQLIGLTLLIKSFNNIGFVFYDKELQFKKRFIFNFSGVLVDFIITVAGVIIWRNVWPIVIGKLAGYTVQCFMTYCLHPYRPRLSSEFGKARELWSFGKWILISGILSFLVINIDDFFVGILIGIEILGFYQLAYKISNVPATELTVVINQVTFPTFSKLQDDLSKLREAYFKVFKIISFSSFFAGGLILVFAYDFIMIILGEKWFPIIIAMQILALWGILRSLWQTTAPVFRSIGKPRIITIILSIELIIIAISIYPLTIIMQYGIVGTSISVFLSVLIANFITYYILIKEIKCKKWEFFKLIVLPMINAIIMILAVLLIRTHWIESYGFIEINYIGLLELGFMVAIALLLYLGITLIYEKIFDYKLIKELFNVYKQLIKRKI